MAEGSGSEQSRRVRAQRRGDPVERFEPGRGLPRLDPAQVRALDARQPGQLYLCELAGFAEGTNGLPQCVFVAHGVTPNTYSEVLQLTHYGQPQEGSEGVRS